MGLTSFLKPIILCFLLVFVANGQLIRPPSQEDSKKVDVSDLNDAAEDTSYPVKLDDEIEYKTPMPGESVHLFETFDDTERAQQRWIQSRAKKEDIFKYEGKWGFELPKRRILYNDHGLVLHSRAKHAAISAKLDRKFVFENKPLIVQYEVTFQKGMECGGAYIKLLSDSEDMGLEQFHDKTPYTIMFGPDKCGSDIKLHFIFRHVNPINGSIEEKHAKQPSNLGEGAYHDKTPHLYRLVVKPDNRFEVFVDGLLINQGSLLEDMDPPVNPPIEIEDPDDKKPTDWDDIEKIPDEKAIKPADWDEEAPPKIPDPDALVPSGWLLDEPDWLPDPTAKMPEDWDETMDGSWEAPLIPNPVCEQAVGCGEWVAPLIENPKFKGKWQPPMVSNPNFNGKWTPRLIPNPNYFEDKEPFKMIPIGAVGLEIWSMTDLVLFDNFIISDKESVVNEFTESTYTLKRRALKRDSRSVMERMIGYSNAHPWLFLVYTVLVGLPVVLIFAYFCGESQDEEIMLDPAEFEDVLHEYDPTTMNRERLQRSKHTITVAPSSMNERETRSSVAMSKEDLEQPNSVDVEADKANVDPEYNENDDAESYKSANSEHNSKKENEPNDDEYDERELTDKLILNDPELGIKKRKIRRD